MCVWVSKNDRFAHRMITFVIYEVDVFNAHSAIFLSRFAFDLYQNTTVNVHLSFTNPYHKTTAVSYSHKTKVSVLLPVRRLSLSSRNRRHFTLPILSLPLLSLQELYTLNKGNQLAYPVKYRDDLKDLMGGN